VKQARIKSSPVALVGIVFLVGANGGGVSRSIDFGGNHKYGGMPPFTTASMGVVVIVRGVDGASRIV
jgi:hypothetical protein